GGNPGTSAFPVSRSNASTSMDCRLRGNDGAARSCGRNRLSLRPHVPPPSTMPITPQEALQRTIEHREIFHDEMVELMRQIMGGQVSPVMTAAILSGLRVKKETVGEIAGAAVAMRE